MKKKGKWNENEKKRRGKHRINGRSCAETLRKIDTTGTSWPYMCHAVDETSTCNKCIKHERRSNKKCVLILSHRWRDEYGGNWWVEK